MQLGSLLRLVRFAKMAQCFLLVFGVIVVLLLVTNTIGVVSIQYVSEKGMANIYVYIVERKYVTYYSNIYLIDLMDDPTLCSTTKNEYHFILKDIARQSNGINVLTVFGQSSGISLFMTFDNFNSSKYYYLCKRKVYIYLSNRTLYNLI